MRDRQDRKRHAAKWGYLTCAERVRTSVNMQDTHPELNSREGIRRREDLRTCSQEGVQEVERGDLLTEGEQRRRRRRRSATGFLGRLHITRHIYNKSKLLCSERSQRSPLSRIWTRPKDRRKKLKISRQKCDFDVPGHSVSPSPRRSYSLANI